MPNTLAITLHASGVETTTGAGTPPVDLGDRTLVELTLDATAFAATTVVTVIVETSRTGTEWIHAGRFDALSKPATRALVVADAMRYVRARWNLSGTAPSVTFSLAGVAHQLYAVPSDVARYGLPAAALEMLPPEQIARACLAASGEAEGYLSSAYKLPLATWDIGTRSHVAKMAAYEAMRWRGFDPDSGKDASLEVGRGEAITWLNRIANGKLRPVGIVDSTPEAAENEVYVASERGRSWRV